MRRSMMVAIALLVAARAAAAESPTMRAADAGVAPGFCSALRAVVDAAERDFTALRGRARTGSEHVWNATKRLPGAIDCSVYGGRPSAYTCTLYAGDVEDNADATYERAASAVKDCLSGGSKTTERVDGTHARTTRIDRDDGLRVRVVSRDASADAYLVDVWVDAGRR
jgi:hypothetical protein